MFIMDHMVIQPVIIKFSDGIRKWNKGSFGNLHKCLIPFLPGKYLVGIAAALYYFCIT